MLPVFEADGSFMTLQQLTEDITTPDLTEAKIMTTHALSPKGRGGSDESALYAPSVHLLFVLSVFLLL